MKRFTETDKWRDSWFRKLKPLSKLAFIYLVDNCDGSGVWDPDFELANFAIGEEVDWVVVNRDFGERIIKLKNGKWFLTRFVEFQYGKLVEECRPHAKVLQLLKAHGIPYSKGIGRVSIPTGSRQDKDNTVRDPEQPPEVDENPEGEKATAVISADSIYEVYPRKDARQDALKAIIRAMDRAPPAKLLAATQAYGAAVSKWPLKERKFIPYAATWFNRERYNDDPKTWIYNANDSPSNSRGFENQQDYSGVTDK